MLGIGSREGGLKRFDIGGGGGRLPEILFAVALGAIIVGGAWLSYMHGCRGSKGTPVKPGDMLLHFKCEKCGHEFTKKPSDRPEPTPEMFGPSFSVTDCPKCGGEKCAYLMIKCPNCGKYYVSESHKAMVKALESPDFRKAHTPAVRDVCPYCKVDRIDFYREKQKKKRK